MKTIGRYELQEKLGEGGMGVVYRAHDPLIDRTIAVKLISASLEGNVDLRERFFREARAAGQLSHRNIITIHDLGEHEGQPYLAMEYLEGHDLQRRLTRGAPMTLMRKVELAIAICEGLEYAHSRGVVHRDIKPANMFITDSGTVKILDFGLARMITSEMTQSSALMGTLNYMAPEQVRGERADHRSDIFSTGVMFYELLGGRKAFEADSVAATLYKILEVVPEPLHQLDPSLPAELVTVVDQALKKSRDERYQNMGEMLRDLMVARYAIAQAEPLPGSAGVAPAIAYSGVTRPSSNPGRPSTPPPSVPSVPPDVSSTAPTVFLPGSPRTPAPTLSPPAVFQPSDSPPPVTPPPLAGRSRGPLAAGALAMFLVAGALVLWLTTGRSDPDAQAPVGVGSPSAAAVDPSAEAAALARAAEALGGGDYESARRQADAVLAKTPADPDALEIRDRAVQTGKAVQDGLRQARLHQEAGRHDEAARAAGEVLTLAPGNPDAKGLMEESAAQARGRGAEEARVRMAQAKAAAAAVRAPALASALYGAAQAAEADAGRLSIEGRFGEATAKYYEASGLFRSAELGARNEAAAARARAAERAAEGGPVQSPPAPDSNPGSADPPPGTPPPPAPAVTVTDPPAGTERKPSSPPGPPPANTSPEAAVRDLLTRYEAALESRSLDALKRIWPKLAGTQLSAQEREFENANRIDVEIEDPAISIAGASATVTFIRRYEMRSKEGRINRAAGRTMMTLARAGNDWVIETIRFEPVR